MWVGGVMAAAQVIEPDDYKDAALLASRQARRNLLEAADGDAEMETAEEEKADTRPTKTVTNEITINVQRPLRCWDACLCVCDHYLTLGVLSCVGRSIMSAGRCTHHARGL